MVSSLVFSQNRDHTSFMLRFQDICSADISFNCRQTLLSISFVWPSLDYPVASLPLRYFTTPQQF